MELSTVNDIIAHIDFRQALSFMRSHFVKTGLLVSLVIL